MATWNEILAEIKATDNAHNVVRKKYIAELSTLTGRNTIVYYSGWLQKALEFPGFGGFSLSDADINGFMATINKLDTNLGLDLVLHTPGGDGAATESLVAYLRSKFGNNIRAIVPQLAMSAGTMIALSCKEVVMGKHSSLGPIDPQLAGLPAHGVIEEFRAAMEAVRTNPPSAAIWQMIIAKYHPTFIGECQKAITWSKTLVTEWLTTGMFHNEPNAHDIANRIVKELADHEITLSHARHISISKAKDLGIKIVPLEDSQELQDAVLTLHHACMQTLGDSNIYKLIENQNGIAHAQMVQGRI